MTKRQYNEGWSGEKRAADRALQKADRAMRAAAADHGVNTPEHREACARRHAAWAAWAGA